MANAALDLLSTPLTALARELKVSPETLRSYRLGRRIPSRRTAQKLAELCWDRSKALADLASEIHRGGAR